ncbi:MAG: ABC transporter permease [bacterium]
MLQLGKIAFRNILKNNRRSSVTVLAITMGFAAVSLFRGYTYNSFERLRESAIRGEGLGHLTLFRNGWRQKAKVKPELHMFSNAEVQNIIDLVKKDEDVILATPQINIEGLASNGRISSIFLARGVVPGDDKIIKGPFASRRPVKGDILSDTRPAGVEMAEGLASILGLEPGSDGVVMATTYEGQMNALDFEVLGVYDTGTAATNDKYIRVPFIFAQSLYETDKADRVVVLLNNWRKTEDVRKRLMQKLAHAGFDCEIMTWNELSLFYSQVKGMFDMIFLFLFIIVFIIVVTSIVNTMGMAVIERTREIGTLRALGLKRRGVSILFGLEGAFLGFLGSLGGVVVTIVAWTIIKIIRPTYIPPGISTEVPLVVTLLPGTMVGLLVFLIFLSVIASVGPARRAAHKMIVDALGHV